MPERRWGTVGVALVTLCLAIVAVLLVRAWADKPREFVTATPQPSPLVSTPVIPVPGGSRVCVSSISLLPAGRVALVRVGTRGKPSVDLSAVVTGPGGYRSADRIPRSRWVDNDLLRFRIAPPRRPVEGRFCLRNGGRRVIDVYASNDRTKSLAVTRVDGGRRRSANVQLAFVEDRPGTVAGHRGSIARRITAFKPGVIVPWDVWLVGALVALACVLGPAAALILALRARRSDGPA